MAKSVRCGDIFPGCDFVALGRNDDEVIAVARKHANETHGLAEMDWALLAKYCAAIHNDEQRLTAS